MKTLRSVLAALVALSMQSALRAQVPQLLNHQGRVAVDGVNFDGTGQFKFALVNDAGDTTYWSNDGSSTAGSEPAAAVTLPVTRGHYAVLLGDASLANMTGVLPSVFNNSDVRLRVWFDDGAHGSQLLAPDQRLAAAGYAMTAGSVNLPATTTTGEGALRQNGERLLHSFGNFNFFAGPFAGNFTMTGYSNAASGFNALSSNTTGNQNTATGSHAMVNNTGGFANTATGYVALGLNTMGAANTATGSNALSENKTGNFNTATGSGALVYNTGGSYNTASGAFAIWQNKTGNHNTASGYRALERNTLGEFNTAAGSSVLEYNTTGKNNTAIGIRALGLNTSGNDNIAMGYEAGILVTTGDFNIAIGNTGGLGDSNTIRIGTADNHARAFVAGIRGTTTGVNDAVPVVIDSEGQLGIVSSSRRYKVDIADMGDASERLHALRPVTFRYKEPFANGGKPIQYGLIAEEVAETFPELVVRNADDQPETVKYQDLAPLLLNEVQKLRAENEELKKQLAERDVRDKEHDTRLARIESLLVKTTPKTNRIALKP